VGSYTGSGNHCGNPEFSEYRVSQCRPSGAFIHDRVPSSRYKGNPVSEFQEILFLNIISAVIVDETRNSLWNATMVRRRVHGKLSHHALGDRHEHKVPTHLPELWQ
jgi:hypothetical protein